MILITDAHVCPAGGNVEAWFAMLERLEMIDEPIVFLGDIFDLWVSLPGFQDEHHRRFLQWCRARSQSQEIGFIEGNHEFFMLRNHRDCFSWSDEAGHRRDTHLFVHGDLINRADKNYLRFRRLTKNPVTRTIVRFLPGGPRLAQRLKRDLKGTNKAFRIGIPEQAIADYAESQFATGIRHIFVGHFHQTYHYRGKNGGELHILKDWLSQEVVTRFDGKSCTTLPWREL